MEAKQVKDLMEAYASVYAQSEHVIAESDCECEDEKSEKETDEMNGKKKGKKEEEKEEVTEAKRIAHGTGKKVMPSAKERSALAKKARAGKDIGKPGKGFEKVAAKAAKQYGSEEAGKRVAAAAMFKAQAKEEVETDLFDVILEYLVAEGYADTNQSALVIMANMSEDWRQNIVETIAGGGYTPNPVGNAIRSGSGILQKVMRNPSVQGAIKTGSQMLQKRVPTGGYSTRPGDGKPYADGPLWDGPETSVKKPTPQPQRKPQAPMRDEPLW